jgi:hypothetical protein
MKFLIFLMLFVFAPTAIVGYPHAADAMVFFGIASGLFPGEVTAEDVEFAQEVIKRHGRL